MTGLSSNLEADVTVLSYRISGEEHQLKQHTSTGAKKGHIKAVLKHDSEENHSQVYSELVCYVHILNTCITYISYNKKPPLRGLVCCGWIYLSLHAKPVMTLKRRGSGKPMIPCCTNTSFQSTLLALLGIAMLGSMI